MRLASLIRQEARLQISSTRFRLLAIASVLLAMLSVTIGARDYGFRYDQYEQRYLERQAERVINGSRLYGWKLEPTLRILREPSKLSVFVRGLDSVRPAYWDVSPAGTIEGPVDPSIGQDSEAGEVFDIESVIRIVLGLLALLLAVDSVAGQRANGTLHAVMLQPLRPATIVISKLAAGMISLLLAIGLVLVSASLTVLFFAPEIFRSGTGTFLVKAALIAWAYLMVMYAVGLIIGSLGAGAERATFVAIAVWTFVTLVAPQLVAFGVRAISPVRSRQAMERERQGVFDARLRSTEQFLGTIVAGLDRTEAKKKLSSQESHSWIDTNWRTGAADTRAMVKEYDERYEEDAARQQQVTRWLARFSPGSLLIELTTDAAGTGRHAQVQWERDLANFQQQINASLFDDRNRLSLRPAVDQGNSIESFDRKAGFPMFSDLPSFAQMPSEPADIDQESGNVAALLAFVVVGAGLAFYVFPRSGL